MKPIRAATWNVSWSSTGSKEYESTRRRITELESDILVLTESTHSLIPEGGYFAKGGPDWGYGSDPDRRKVMLWSRWPITDVTAEITDPGGRHVGATVESPLGPLRVHGVCAPWSRAHVSGGRENRKPWEDHLAYVDALGALLLREAADPRTRELPVIVAGDINQRNQPVPHGNRKAINVWADLLASANLTLATDETMIDKVLTGPGLTATDSRILPPERMADDHAVSCLLTDDRGA